jgi:hypothetical protein
VTLDAAETPWSSHTGSLTTDVPPAAADAPPRPPDVRDSLSLPSRSIIAGRPPLPPSHPPLHCRCQSHGMSGGGLGLNILTP